MLTPRLCVACLFVLFAAIASLGAAVPVDQTGLKSFDDWAPDKTGREVVSAKLQAAVDWCQENGRTLYLPPGTYLVDRTIELRTSSSNTLRGRFPQIHGDAYDRPILRLVDGTFPAALPPARAEAVLRLRHERPDRRAAWVYFAVVANVDFDLGDNPGACAVDFPAAQDSHLFNIRVTGRAFSVGFRALPGANQANVNLEVVGGRYGILLGSDAVARTVTGARLYDQSEAALLISNWEGTVITGLDMRGPGVALEIESGQSWRQGRVFVLDSRLDLTHPDRPAVRVANRSVVLREVAVRGTRTLVEGDLHVLPALRVGEWQQVHTYAVAPQRFSEASAVTHVDGLKRTDHVVVDLAPAEAAPADPRLRHLPHETFAFNHPEAVNVLTFPGADAGEKIQAALDGPARVLFVPAGEHAVGAPLRVPVGKALLGDPGKRTFLVPTYTPSGETHLLTTDDTEGFVAVQDLFLCTRDLDFDGAVHWRTSDGFMLNVRAFRGFAHEERDVRVYRFSGQAGGRFYGLADHRNMEPNAVPASVAFRKVLVEGTAQPITFYGLNLERGGEHRRNPQPAPFGEIVNAANVRLLGLKTEPDLGPAFRVVRSRNVQLAGLGTHRRTGAAILEVDALSEDLEFAHVALPVEGPSHPLVAGVPEIPAGALLAFLRRGTVDTDVWTEAR